MPLAGGGSLYSGIRQVMWFTQSWMSPVVAPGDPGYAVLEFDKSCSKDFPVTYCITVINFSTPLQCSLRKLKTNYVSKHNSADQERENILKVKQSKFVFFCRLLLFPTDMPCSTKIKFVFPLKCWHFQKKLIVYNKSSPIERNIMTKQQDKVSGT